jgi:3-deoxy-manno-octulosonate cytidylyltransferase (CMP-KDO synthetase)
MIYHVWQRAVRADLGPVVIATCGPEIGDVMRSFGANVVETDPNIPSGTDRIWEALKSLPENNYDLVMNLQGDLPGIEIETLKAAIKPFSKPWVDVATVAAPIHNKGEINNENVVKIAMSDPIDNISRAFYFSRQPIPHQAKTYYHHIGVYVYKKHILERFVSLLPTSTEKCERLEQLRGLEDGMSFGVAVVNTPPQSVDTQADLDLVRLMWKN